MRELDPSEEDRVECADCGAEIAGVADGSYVLDEQGVLCFECAVRRGGQYDGPKDHWTVPPDVSGLSRREAMGG